MLWRGYLLESGGIADGVVVGMFASATGVARILGGEENLCYDFLSIMSLREN